MKRMTRSEYMKKHNPMKNKDVVTKMKRTRKKLNRFGHNNPNWKGGKIIKVCDVCKTSFRVFPSLKHIKTCKRECANILRSINSTKPNLGKNKNNCEHMSRISKMKLGVKKTNEEKKNISIGTKREVWKPSKRERFLRGNKTKDMSFTKTKEWIEKVMKSKHSKKYIYKDIHMRSNWEIKYAKWLDRKTLHWEYEPIVTRLKSIGKCYCPDFYVKEWDKYIEVKGYMSEEGQQKINMFKEKFGDSKLIVVDEKKMKELGLI